MKRLMEKIVFCALMMALLRATRPTRRSWFLLTATTDGTNRSPSADGITIGSPPLITAATELVVPRSMPMILPISSPKYFSTRIPRKSEWREFYFIRETCPELAVSHRRVASVRGTNGVEGFGHSQYSRFYFIGRRAPTQAGSRGH